MYKHLKARSISFEKNRNVCVESRGLRHQLTSSRRNLPGLLKVKKTNNTVCDEQNWTRITNIGQQEYAFQDNVWSAIVCIYDSFYEPLKALTDYVTQITYGKCNSCKVLGARVCECKAC